MCWPSSSAVWGPDLTAVQDTIVEIALIIAELEPVSMLARPEEVVSIRSLLKGVEIIDAPVDDLWARDTLPNFLVRRRADGKTELSAGHARFNGWAFSTISEGVDVADALNEAGFRAVRQFTTPPRAGDILVVNSGATLLLYATEHDAETIQRLVDYLQKAPFAGVIFTREAMPGTFALKAVHIDSPAAPDVVVAMRWADEKSKFGVSGTLFADAPRLKGHGMHGSLSPFDMRNTLIAAGPDFSTGTTNEMPTGNIDVAPTILWILGVRPTEKLDGRVLREAFRGASTTATIAPKETVLNAEREIEGGRWQQYLRQVEYGDVTYFIEGNGKQIAP